MMKIICAVLLTWAASARAAIRIVSGRDDEAAPERPLAVEFTGKDGRVLKRLSLEPRTGEDIIGAPDAYDALLSASGTVVVVTHWRRDPWLRDPYALRRSQSTEVAWYARDGALLGRRDFSARTQVMAISPDGSTTILVDAGFDRRDLAAFQDRPVEALAGDHELIDHRVYAARPSGDLILTRTIKGPEAPPRHVVVSPSGRWFLYKLDSPDVYVDNALTGKEDRYVHPRAANWGVNDKGQLVPVETASAREP